MADGLRWGLLSTSWITVALVPALRRARRSTTVAIASRSLEKAQRYADDNGIPVAYGSYEELLADPRVDVIYNSLPNSLHHEWTVKAVSAGKHVLCEKPLVLSFDELDEVESAAWANAITVIEGLAYLHHPQLQMILELVAEGKLGELQLLTCWDTFTQAPDDGTNYRYDPAMGGGSLWDVGIYPVSLAVALNRTGQPVEVWADQVVGETGIDLSMAAQLRFADGMIAHISSSFRAPEQRGARLTGSHGVLEIADHLTGQEWPGESAEEGLLTLTAQDGSVETIVVPAVDAYQTEVEAMEACVLDGAEPPVPLSLSRQILSTILAIYRSARKGLPEKV